MNELLLIFFLFIGARAYADDITTSNQKALIQTSAKVKFQYCLKK